MDGEDTNKLAINNRGGPKDINFVVRLLHKDNVALMCKEYKFVNLLMSMVQFPFQGPTLQWMAYKAKRESLEGRKNQYVLRFRFGAKVLTFGPMEFALVTGLPFGAYQRQREPRDMGESEFSQMFRGDKLKITVGQMTTLFEEQCRVDNNSVISRKLAVLYLIHTLVSIRPANHGIWQQLLPMVDDPEHFNECSLGRFVYEDLMNDWGSIIFKIKNPTLKGSASYTPLAFPFAVQAWFFESMSLADVQHLAKVINPNALPRILKWSSEKPKYKLARMTAYDVDQVNWIEMVPTEEEEETDYYKSVHVWVEQSIKLAEQDMKDRLVEDAPLLLPMIRKLQACRDQVSDKLNAFDERLSAAETRISGVQDIENRITTRVINKLKHEFDLGMFRMEKKLREEYNLAAPVIPASPIPVRSPSPIKKGSPIADLKMDEVVEQSIVRTRIGGTEEEESSEQAQVMIAKVLTSLNVVNGTGEDIIMEKTQLMEGSENFKWTIEGFSKLTEPKVYSRLFYLGGVGWRLIVYPRGNLKGANIEGNYLSIYLEVADLETKSQAGWSIDAHFSIQVVSQIHDKFEVKKGSNQVFTAKDVGWGFTDILNLTSLNDPKKGYLVNDTCIIEVIVKVKSVDPPKKRTKAPSETQSHKRKKDSLDFFNEPPSKRECSSAPRALHADPTDSAKVTQSEPPKNNDVTSNEKSLFKGDIVIEENTRSEPLPALFSHFGSLKLRNPPYSLPNGYRITEGAVLDEGDMATQLIQSTFLSSELQSLVEMPVVDLASQGYYHLAKFLHYHCASVVNAQGLQVKYQEHANVLEESKSRDLEIQKLQLCLGNSVQEASQLRGDLEKVKDENVKVVDEFSAAKEKNINMEGELHKVKDELCASKEKNINLERELQLLRSENIDLQILLEDARKAEKNAAMRAVEDFKASNEYANELRAMAHNGLEQSTELGCDHLKYKPPGFLTNEADAAD